MKRYIKSAKSSSASYLISGILFAACSFTVFSLIFGFAAYLSEDPASLTGIFSVIAMILSFFLMGIFISIRKTDKGTLTSSICALVILCVLLIAELIIKRAQISAPFIINCVCSLGASIIGSLIVKKHNSRRKNHRY